MEGAKLVQRVRLVPTCLLLSGEGERLAGVLPSLLGASRQETDRTEPYDPQRIPPPRTRVDTFTDRLLQQRAPLLKASLERRGSAQARCERSHPVPVAGGPTEDQTLFAHPAGVLQVPLDEVQEAEAGVGNNRGGPPVVQGGQAEGLLPVAPALGKGSEHAQGQRQPRLGPEPQVYIGRPRLPLCSLHAPLQQRSRPAEVAHGLVDQP